MILGLCFVFNVVLNYLKEKVLENIITQQNRSHAMLYNAILQDFI